MSSTPVSRTASSSSIGSPPRGDVGPERGPDRRAVAQQAELGPGEPGGARRAGGPEREPDPLRLARHGGRHAGDEIALERAEVAVDAERAPPLGRGERERVPVPAEAGVLPEALDRAGDEIRHAPRSVTSRPPGGHGGGPPARAGHRRTDGRRLGERYRAAPPR